MQLYVFFSADHFKDFKDLNMLPLLAKLSISFNVKYVFRLFYVSNLCILILFLSYNL